MYHELLPSEMLCLTVKNRMVNNAGISIEAADPQPIHTTTEETWDITMRVNAKSVFLGCKYAVAQMLKQDIRECGSRGWIINISSIYGLKGGERIGMENSESSS
jgi:NAD(P)-dependent dehydrogenase (short-subunit alcohol dehydrogenase family)